MRKQHKKITSAADDDDDDVGLVPEDIGATGSLVCVLCSTIQLPGGSQRPRVLSITVVAAATHTQFILVNHTLRFACRAYLFPHPLWLTQEFIYVIYTLLHLLCG